MKLGSWVIVPIDASIMIVITITKVLRLEGNILTPGRLSYQLFPMNHVDMLASSMYFLFHMYKKGGILVFARKFGR